MSQEKVDFYKDKKAKRKEEAANAKKKKAGKTFRDILFAAILIGIAVGVIVSIVNMVGVYNDSLPEYDATGYALSDYAEVATTTAEETDISDVVSGDGEVVVEDSDSDGVIEINDEGSVSESDVESAVDEQIE